MGNIWRVLIFITIIVLSPCIAKQGEYIMFYINEDPFVLKEGDSLEYSLHLFCMQHDCSKDRFIDLLNELREEVYQAQLFDVIDFGLPHHYKNNDVTRKIAGASIISPTCMEFHLDKYECNQAESFGDASIGGEYLICLDFCGDPGVVYSVGIHEDISFDVDIANRGFQVFSFDPSELTQRYVDNLLVSDMFPKNVTFHPIGLGGTDGMFPINDGSKVSSDNAVPLLRLETLMEYLDHSSISVLKMDIEGYEIIVLKDITTNSAHILDSIGQICFEFHWNPDYTSIPVHVYTQMLDDAFQVLHGHGFKEFHRGSRRKGSLQVLCMVRVLQFSDD